MAANIDPINDILIQKFSEGAGEAYLNTLDGGGGYSFLLNKAGDHPLLIINMLNFKAGINAKLIMDHKDINFSCKSLKELIDKFQLKSICINHLIWAGNFSETFGEIIDACQSIELNIYLHDFFTLCPTINLLDFNGQYCGVPSYVDCKNCINNYPQSANATGFAKKQMLLYLPELNGDIRNWRNLWLKIFNQARFIIVPSVSTAEIFGRAYGREYQEKIIVKPHSVKEASKIKLKNNVTKNSFMNIYLLGYIDEHKGSRILKKLIDKTAKARLNICYHVLGWFEYPNYVDSPFLKLHGAYKPEQLPELLNKLEIDMFMQPSICPETFSYVIHEMKATALPILAFNIGAQADFLANYKYARLVNEITADAMFNEIVNLYNKHLETLYPVLQADNSNHEIRALVKLLQEKNLEDAEQHYLIDKLRVQIDSEESNQAIKNHELLARNQELIMKCKQLENISHDIKVLLNSRSWKITKPLRLFGKLARKLKA
ncbi:MAG TPA: glycosyltransferase [Aquella sp.]|nr:glycosyltransferase [Aquella sp.]